MPKNNAKPWENGGKGGKKKTNGRVRRSSPINRNKNDNLSKERIFDKIKHLTPFYVA